MTAPDGASHPAAPALVVLDIGNTAVKVVAFDARGGVLSADRIHCIPGLALPPILSCGVPVVAVSVSDPNLALVELALGRPLALLHPPAPDPTGTGLDRLCAAAAAHARAGGAAIAAGLGTAVTVDGVGDSGGFRGGFIAPGLHSAAAGLTAAAPRLPAPDLAPGPPFSGPGRSTRGALRGGFLLGFAGLVDRLIEELRASAGGAEIPVFLHGGDADAVGPLLRTRCVAAPHLVAEGARLLFLARS